MTFCNRTDGAIEAALGRRQDDVWTSEGWWMLEPGQCSKVLAGPLTERFYFYFATSLVRPAKDQDPFTWGGKYQFCTSNKPFMVEGDADCEGKGYITRGFQEIDIGANNHDYTLDFKGGGVK
jgi:uncharacterized membrane protein